RAFLPSATTSSDSWEKNMGSAWPLHKDDTLFRSGRPTGLNIYALFRKDLRSESFFD
ncbi:hypothetical protein DFH08DRAFT_709017, partial [Mycena albidolilacea]